MRCTCPACAKEVEANVAEDAGRIHCIHCGHEFHPVAALPTSEAPARGEREVLAPGTRLGQFVIEGVLGAGGTCVVYRAIQTSLKRPVALKVLPRSLADDAHFVRRFRREARALAELSHPNIVAIYERGEEAGRFFLAMELVEGMTLRRWVEARRDRPHEWLPLMLPVWEAIEYAHGRSFVHRDIKPENILVDRQGRPKVADFGLVRLIRGNDPRTASLGDACVETTFQESADDGLPVGTAGYAAPEQRTDPLSAGRAADLYSFGVVIFEMLTGSLPGKEGFVRPSDLAPVDPRIDDLVRRLMEKDPVWRYLNAWRVREDLEEFLRVMLPRDEYDAQVRARWTRLRRRVRRWRRTRGAVALACALPGAGFLFRAGLAPAHWMGGPRSPAVAGVLLSGVSVVLVRSFLPAPRSREESWPEVFALARLALPALLCLALVIARCVARGEWAPAFLRSPAWFPIGGLISWSGLMGACSAMRSLKRLRRDRAMGIELLGLAILAALWAFLGSSDVDGILTAIFLLVCPFMFWISVVYAVPSGRPDPGSRDP